MKKIIVSVSITFIFFMMTSFVIATERSELSGKLLVFHAGSLAVPFKQIRDEFKKQHPNVDVELEAAGSRICARKISELHRRCDVMASADYSVIDKLLIPEFAEWNIKFAANEMAIVYTDKSRRANEITVDNWYDILLDKKVVIGRSEPNVDPCGYRAVLTIKLAELYSQKKGLAKALIAKDHRYIRPKETDLLALLEMGSIDYIFLYRSVARQHGLKFLRLPDQINLKSTEYEDIYAKSSVKISGKTPGTFINKIGAPMVYGLTIPKNAPNPVAALAFVDFLLDSNQGMKIIEKCGQPTVIPTKSERYNYIPERLKKYALPL